MKYAVTVFVPTSINSDEIEVEADSLAEAEAKVLKMAKAEDPAITWNILDVEANLNLDMVEIAEAHLIEEEQSA